MPLVGYHLAGFDKGPLSFAEHDIRLLSSERHRQKTYDFFASSPFNFNLFFNNGTWGSRKDYLLRGKISCYKDVTEYEEEIEYITGGGKRNPHAINVVFTNNRGNSRFNIPMTPWIMAHRMGHIQMVPDMLKPIIEHGFDILLDVYDYRLETDGLPNEGHWNTHLRPYMDTPHCDARVFHGLFVHLLTTRAARLRQIRPWFEYHAEWMAQYIRYNRLIIPTHFPDLDLDILVNEIDRPLVPFPDRKILHSRQSCSTDEFCEDLSRSYYEKLTSWVGEVVVT